MHGIFIHYKNIDPEIGREFAAAEMQLGGKFVFYVF